VRLLIIGCVALSVVGLYFLCMTESLALGIGDLYVLLCAFCFSIHILVIDHFSPKVDGVRMSCIQFFVCGIISTVISFIFENPNVSAILSGWLPILYAGVLSCGVAYTLQIIGQKNMDPTVASLILSLESVFSVLAGWVILKQTLSVRELFGCVLMFLAIILAQLPEKSKSL
jgi:drug/metabolite transporter (DMT)-like permease